MCKKAVFLQLYFCKKAGFLHKKAAFLQKCIVKKTVFFTFFYASKNGPCKKATFLHKKAVFLQIELL